MRIPWWLRTTPALLLSLSTGPSLGASPAVTVYTRDLGFVRETRTLELSGTRDTLRLVDVPRQLDFSSVRLAPAGGARVGRLAFRFDVASGDAMLERALGSRVTVTLRDDRVVEGSLVAADGSWLTVREEAGSLHTLSRPAVHDVRLADPPADFSLRPTLEAVVEGGKRGRVEAELSYLTGGLSWGAEHTVVRAGETQAVWSADVTVQNTTGRDYVDATLKLVAGEPSRRGPPPIPAFRAVSLAVSEKAAAADLEEQTFSEYHLYSLGRPATLRDRESQKLTMLEPRAITVAPRYLYRGGDPRGVRSQIEVQNDKAAGLGSPLPGGRVRMYERDADGALQFAGETGIGHTAEGEKLTLDVGVAFDLAAERREIFNRRISNREREYAIEIKLRNRKKSNVMIVVEEGVGGDSDISQNTHPFTRKDANTIEFTVPVRAGKEEVVSYTARVRY